ncbi:MAG TPA: methyltransferase domain-containing protein [Terriglobales bacterium]|jgi:phospholipid N-methyltransferase
MARSARTPSARAPSTWDSYRLFFAQFRQHFVLTGAIAPSGPALAQAITAPLAQAGRGAARAPVRVLEVGAGTGVFTAAILRCLAPGDELDVYEINPNFQACLEARLAANALPGVDCRLHIAAIGGLQAAQPFDFIISALPLNNFSAVEVEAILKLLMGHLRPGGTLSYFEYPFVRQLKRMLVTNAAERARLRAVGEVVHSFLGRHPCRQAAVPLNLPPAVAHHILKPEVA